MLTFSSVFLCLVAEKVLLEISVSSVCWDYNNGSTFVACTSAEKLVTRNGTGLMPKRTLTSGTLSVLLSSYV